MSSATTLSRRRHNGWRRENTFTHCSYLKRTLVRNLTSLVDWALVLGDGGTNMTMETRFNNRVGHRRVDSDD